MFLENLEDSEKNDTPLTLSDFRGGTCGGFALVSREKRRRSLPDRPRLKPSVEGRLDSRVEGGLEVEVDGAGGVSVSL